MKYLNSPEPITEPPRQRPKKWRGYAIFAGMWALLLIPFGWALVGVTALIASVFLFMALVIYAINCLEDGE